MKMHAVQWLRACASLCLPLLTAALAGLAGCGGVDCDNAGAPFNGPSFSVNLALPPGDIPADIEIKLEGGGVSLVVGLSSIGEIGASSPCTRQDGGGIRCEWGEDAGKGTFDASAAGHAPVHLALEAMSLACNGLDPDHENATLAAQ